MAELLTLTRDVRGRPPLVLRWGRGGRALPVQTVRSLGRPGPDRGPPDWIWTGPAEEPFDFGRHVRRLCADIVGRCPDLRHVRPDGVLFAFTQARTGLRHGLQARVTPLRFRGGELVRKHRGTPFQVQRFVVDGVDLLYLMTFCLPRFLEQPFDDKLVTLFHELYHIGPAFDGDLRRHAGRYDVHSHSKRAYDRHMAHLARAYLANGADPSLHAFLRLNFAQLRHRHGAVVGVVVPRPKLIPLTTGAPEPMAGEPRG